MIPRPSGAHQRSLHLTERPWPEVGSPLLLVPLGSAEQHGPHLPVDTDAVIAAAVASRLAERVAGDGIDAVVAPALNYGASGEHAGFAGTVSIGHEALEHLLLEYGRSACEWARRLVFVNGHGGNIASLSLAVARLISEGRDTAWLPCANGYGLPGPEEDAHAGHVETSLMLHIAPERVHMQKAEPGVTVPLEQILPQLMAGGVTAVSPNGILGDPTAATAEDGATLLDAVVNTVHARLSRWDLAETGCLA